MKRTRRWQGKLDPAHFLLGPYVDLCTLGAQEDMFNQGRPVRASLHHSSLDWHRWQRNLDTLSLLEAGQVSKWQYMVSGIRGFRGSSTPCGMFDMAAYNEAGSWSGRGDHVLQRDKSQELSRDKCRSGI